MRSFTIPSGETGEPPTLEALLIALEDAARDISDHPLVRDAYVYAKLRELGFDLRRLPREATDV